MITILADEGKGNIGAELHREFLSRGAAADYIPLEHVRVQPCVNCGGCTYKTYNKCVARDDGDWILPKVIRADALLLVTPIVFGSYSFKSKRVLDKFGLIMDRHYFAQNGELVKGGMRGKRFRFFAVGTGEDCSDTEMCTFQGLIGEILTITRGAGRAFVAGAALGAEQKTRIVEEVLGS